MKHVALIIIFSRRNLIYFSVIVDESKTIRSCLIILTRVIIARVALCSKILSLINDPTSHQQKRLAF